MNRRGFLGSILAAGAAPVIVRAASLMPIVPAKIIAPSSGLVVGEVGVLEGMRIIKSRQPGLMLDDACMAIAARMFSQALYEEASKHPRLFGLSNL